MDDESYAVLAVSVILIPLILVALLAIASVVTVWLGKKIGLVAFAAAAVFGVFVFIKIIGGLRDD